MFVLTTGSRWRDLPPELDCGSWHTAWCSTSCPTVGSWTGRGRASTGCRCGPKGSELTGPNPTDTGKPGSKYHLLCDANGLPLHVLVSADQHHDSLLFEPLLETNPAVRRPRGTPRRPRHRPDKLHADNDYDFRRCRTYLHRRGIGARIAAAIE